MKKKRQGPLAAALEDYIYFKKRSVIQLTFGRLHPEGKGGLHNQKCLSSHHGLTEQCSVSLPLNSLIKVQLQTPYMTSNVFH